MIEQKSRSKKVITKKLGNDSDSVENLKKNQSESNVSVFTRSTNPKVVVGAEKVDKSILCSTKWHSWRIMKFVFMMVMGILLVITFFVSLRTYHIVENMNMNYVSSLN